MTFSADWLTLRHRADVAARNRQVAARLGHAFAGREGLRVLDLGAGTGNNMRLTSQYLPGEQHWVLADADAALLARVLPVNRVRFETRVCDLATDLDDLMAEHVDLVTASALFDLCGAAWLDRLIAALGTANRALFAVLSYDGREEWSPPHPADSEVLRAFHADQRQDKGLGPSLGPEAHAYLAEGLRAKGFEVIEGTSDWVLAPPADRAMIASLAEAGGAIAGNREWAQARARADGARIGHKDLLALPPR
ncbi:MAG: hypothetical protein AAGD47_02895 [Pseudomonadota bacterium]